MTNQFDNSIPQLGTVAPSLAALIPHNTLPSGSSRRFDTFLNPHPTNAYQVSFTCEELTCLCPVTHQPDFARVQIDYQPNLACVELKSLKYYLYTFRNEGHFHEDLTNLILNDLVSVLHPYHLALTVYFGIRGGINTTVAVEYTDPDLMPSTS